MNGEPYADIQLKTNNLLFIEGSNHLIKNCSQFKNVASGAGEFTDRFSVEK